MCAACCVPCVPGVVFLGGGAHSLWPLASCGFFCAVGIRREEPQMKAALPLHFVLRAIVGNVELHRPPPTLPVWGSSVPFPPFGC